MANGPPSEKSPSLAQTFVYATDYGGRHLSTCPGAALPHVGSSVRTTCIKNVKFRITKVRTGCQYVGYFYYSENLNWAAQNLLLGNTRAADWT